MNNMTIRYATQCDYTAVEAIMQEVQTLHVNWRPDIYKSTDTVYTKDYFEKLVTEQHLLVAEIEKTVVGLLSFYIRHIESDKQVTRDILFVDDLAVKDEYQKRGIGTALLNFIKEKVKTDHLDALELQVNARNTGARRMYASAGFTEKSINLEWHPKSQKYQEELP